MLIQLPVETWIEILDWLKRRDLLKKLDSLWDREFTPIVHDWMHKYTRNVKLGRLCTESDGLSVVSYEGSKKVPFANVDMPGNVTSFERIIIKYLDTTALAFLRRMRPLFNNIHLGIDDFYAKELPTAISTALHALMPMISSNSSIESLTLNHQLLQFFLVNHPSILSNAKLLQIWDDIKLDATSEWLANWLFTPRQDGQPRTLMLFYCENLAGFWKKLRERFLAPTRQSACPFFVRVYYNSDDLPNATVIENVRTGEQLAVNGKLITNCPINNVDPEWLAKKGEEVRKWNFPDQQVIWLDALNEPLDDDESDEESENDDEHDDENSDDDADSGLI